MQSTGALKILFIINPRSGNQSLNWEQFIETYFKTLNHVIQLFVFNEGCRTQDVKDQIANFQPDIVVAVGGDGTVNLVAECLLGKNIPLAILPAGSANGMAKELRISERPTEALPLILSGITKTIHGTMINGKLCLHLSDIGFNARMIERFQTENVRGLWGYLKATINVARTFLFINPMQMSLQLDELPLEMKAAMIVIANAKKYGSGAVINPLGDLEDELFEVIVVKKISVLEVFKMLISHSSFNPRKTEIFQVKSLKMKLTKKNHFQIDGEYLGKVNEISAYLLPNAIQVIVPDLTIHK